MALNAQIGLLQRQRLARCHAQLPFHQIQPRDGLRYGMLHLQACVHLHEVELHFFRLLVAARLLHDEFHRASTGVVHRPRCIHSRFAHRLSHRLRQTRCRRFFQHLLMPPLHRAIALKQIHIVAMRIAKHLNLNMAGFLHVFFNQHCIVAKTVDGFAFAGSQRRRKIF